MLAVERTSSKPEERRKHARVKVALSGRLLMMSDQREVLCTTIDMSPGGAAIRTDVAARIGGRVICYLDHIGRIDGTIVRLLAGGFAMTINATIRKRDKLAAQLTWLANRAELGLPEDRRHKRIVPNNPIAIMTLPDGQAMPIRLVDISLSGAAVSSASLIPIGTPVLIGATRGRIVRMIENGFAVEFARPLQDHDLDAQTVL